MKPPLPSWSVPLLLALTGIVAFASRFDATVVIVGTVATVAVSAYVLARFRAEAACDEPRPASNVLSLYPGNLLVLLMLALLDRPGLWAGLWAIIPVATLLYDAAGRSRRLPSRARLSISIGLYVILWADLFLLLERAIVLHRGLTGDKEIMIAAVIGLAGAVFLTLGVARHRMTVKE